MARIVKLNEGQLRKLVRGMLNEAMGAELQAGDGYKLYVLPKRDEDLDDVVEHIGAWRQESGTLWPVLLNSGIPVQKPGAPFDGYYAIGFDPRNPELALDFADDIGHLLADSLTE